MSSRKWVIGGVIFFSILVLLFLWLVIIISYFTEEHILLSEFGDKVALVKLTGVIVDSEPIIRQLKKYTDDASVKVIVLRIDSPGGGVAASQEIFEQIKKIRQQGKKVVVSMGAVAASGGYYVACAADTIVANPGTLTGSIGVIMAFANTEELLKKVGLKVEVIKSGRYKDIGSVTRPMTDDEKQLLQNMLDDVYNQFVDVIVQRRGLARETVITLSDGRLFTGKQAYDYRLVDVLGSLDDSIELAAQMVGIKGKPQVVTERKRGVSIFDLFSKVTDKFLLPEERTVSLEYRMF